VKIHCFWPITSINIADKPYFWRGGSRIVKLRCKRRK